MATDAVDLVKARALAPSVAPKGAAPLLALGVHLGFVLVCVSTAITDQQGLSKRAWLPLIATGMALVIGCAVTKGKLAQAVWGKLLLALGIGIALQMSGVPRLSDLPGMGWFGGPVLDQLAPSLATLGSLVVLIFWLATVAAGGERLQRPVPYRWALLASFLLVVITGAVMRAYLAGYYPGVRDPLDTYDLLLKAVQYLVLMAGALGLSGAPGVRGWAHLYVGLAILAGFARNIPLMMQ